MHVLLIGSGGREHALAWALAASPLLSKLTCAPGNPGIAEIADVITLDVADHAAVIAACRRLAVDFVVIGPEAPLVAGLVDDLAAAGIKALGPGRAAARLEASKAFTKELCDVAHIPTAAYARCADAAAAHHHVDTTGAPIVIKADGLAAGKGVTVAATLADAHAAIDQCFGGAFGAAGAEVVVEECLVGEEVSFFVLSDGSHVLPLASAQDHKRAFDGDLGPNTGGMGATSPAPVMTPALIERTMAAIIRPTIAELARRGTPFRGVLFAGLMITDTGPKLIEYNVRFGDPETQVLMLRLKSDLLPALIATVDGVLDHVDLRWRVDTAICVVMAAKGYPGAGVKGSEIGSLAAAQGVEGVEIFHAGTQLRDGRLLAGGGRVLNVAASGTDVVEARERAYRAVDRIDWPGGFCRRDIGWRALAKPDTSSP